MVTGNPSPVEGGEDRLKIWVRILPVLAQDLRESAMVMNWWAGEEYRQFANAIDRILTYWSDMKEPEQEG